MESHNNAAGSLPVLAEIARIIAAMAADDLDRIAHAHGIRLLLQFGSSVSGKVHPRTESCRLLCGDRQTPSASSYTRSSVIRTTGGTSISSAVTSRGPWPTRLKVVDRDLVTRKMALILADLRAVATIAEKPLDDYLASGTDEVLAERYLERMIGRMIDINYHLITEAGHAPPP